MEDNSNKRNLWREQKQEYRKKRKEFILIYSINDAKTLERLAIEKGMEVPGFIKSLLKAYQNNSGYIPPKENQLKELILEIRKIGNNINQIARYINTNKVITMIDFNILKEQLSILENLIIETVNHPPQKGS